MRWGIWTGICVWVWRLGVAFNLLSNGLIKGIGRWWERERHFLDTQRRSARAGSIIIPNIIVQVHRALWNIMTRSNFIGQLNQFHVRLPGYHYEFSPMLQSFFSLPLPLFRFPNDPIPLSSFFFQPNRPLTNIDFVSLHNTELPFGKCPVPFNPPHSHSPCSPCPRG